VSVGPAPLKQARARGATEGSGPVKQSLARGAPLLPATALLLVFLFGPILWSIYAAFTNTSLSGAGAADSHFVGLSNFREAFNSAGFINSVVLTLVFTLISAIIGQNALGLVLALWMRRSHNLVRAFGGTIVIGGRDVTRVPPRDKMAVEERGAGHNT